MSSQLDTIWDMTPETERAHREHVARRSQERLTPKRNREWLWVLIGCTSIFVYTWVCLWVAF